MFIVQLVQMMDTSWHLGSTASPIINMAVMGLNMLDRCFQGYKAAFDYCQYIFHILS